MEWAIVLVIGLVAGTLSGIVGFGTSIMLLPPLVVVFGPKEAVPIMAVTALMAMIERFSGRLLGMIDLFIIWWFVLLAIGLGVLYRRRTQPIAIGLFGLYAVIIVVLAGVMSAFGRSN